MATFQAGDFPIDPNTVDGTELAARLNRMKVVLDGAVVADAAGNVGIGTTTPNGKFHVIGGTTNASSLATAYSAAAFTLTPKSTSGYSLAFGSGQDDKPYIQMSAAGTVANDMVLQPYGGNLLVGTTVQLGAVVARVIFVSGSNVLALQAGNGSVGAYMTNASSTGDWQPFSFNNNGTSFSQIGSITCTASATAYNTSSDYRLKENVQPMQGALATVAALKPVTYKWKADGSAGQGFIAHELQAVVPDCVTGEKDAVDKDGKPQYQGVDTSFLVATLVAAIQEQQTIIQSLTARLEVLENK